MIDILLTGVWVYFRFEPLFGLHQKREMEAKQRAAAAAKAARLRPQTHSVKRPGTLTFIIYF